MANQHREEIIQKLKEKYGTVKNIGDGYTLYHIPSADFIVYFRYSKISNVSNSIWKTFYGLRKDDISMMVGKESYICFLTDDKKRNIVIPFRLFEQYLLDVSPASDGQYKVSTVFKPIGTELYFNNIGKFNMENYLGLDILFNQEKSSIPVPELSHSQVQSLIGSIGIKKGYDIWIPQNDKTKVDNLIIDFSKVREYMPIYNKTIEHIISEIDVIWFDNTSPVSFYEIEHSTPIYSGLLRFNDVLLTVPGVENFNIVANDDREHKFNREINRPTFKHNKLIERVTFLDYKTIYQWYNNIYNTIYLN